MNSQSISRPHFHIRPDAALLSMLAMVLRYTAAALVFATHSGWTPNPT